MRVPAKDVNFVSGHLDSFTDALSIFEIRETNFWEISGITNIAADKSKVDIIVRELALKLNLKSTEFSIEALPKRDWLYENRKSFPSLRYGRFLIHGSHNRPQNPNGYLNIEVEAGRAFGSGSHESTAGCLLSLLRLFKIMSPKRLMDLGCGSGILSIASIRLWPSVKVTALDIDNDAVQTTLENSKLNKVFRQIRCKQSYGFPKIKPGTRKKFDVIVANILAKPLIDLAPHSASYLDLGGYLILSGLLKAQEREILAIYNSLGFRLIERRRIKEWTTFILRYRKQ